MKNSLQEFMFLSAHYQDWPEVTGAVADYIRSDAFRLEIESISQQPEELARLTICMLKHVALDPLVGHRVEDFINPFKVESNEHFFYIPFNRVTNCIGGFTLPRGSAEAEAVIAAVKKNLGSKMFKAARMHRRLDQVALRKVRRLRLRTEAIYDNAVAEARRRLLGRLDDPIQQQEWREAKEAATDASDAVFVQCYERMRKRIEGVAACAFDKGYYGTGTKTLTAFVAQYLYPEQLSHVNAA